MKEQENNLAVIHESDLSLSDNILFTKKQLQFILQKTPENYIKERPAKGGGRWKYVTGGYIKKCLNLMFGFDWDFEILENQILFGEVVIKGKLTARTGNKTIVKMQYGNKDIVYKKQTPEQEKNNEERQPLSIGNDLKAAATDSLKKCAAELGIAQDIYNTDEFQEYIVDSTDIDELNHRLEALKGKIAESHYKYAKDILDAKDAKRFGKVEEFITDKENELKAKENAVS
jgi:recombination DNA repair RAD52 pathway protein